MGLLLLLGLCQSSVSPPGSKLVSRASLNRIETPRVTCQRCGRPEGRFCICASLPPAPLRLSTRLLVLQHPAEAKKTIASVPLIPLCVDQVRILKGQCFTSEIDFLQESISEGYEPLLLFPGPGATALDVSTAECIANEDGGGAEGLEQQRRAPEQQRRASQSIVASERKKLLVLIDGTWTQARHMHRWSPSLAAACKQVMFESDAASIIDALRREPEKHCTSTLEAFARALRLVEPTERAEQAASYMEGALSAVVQKQLSMVGSSAPRFVDRKKRTWNRKLFRSDGLRKQARAGDVAMVAAPDSIGRSKAVALEAVAGETDEFGHPTLWRSTHHGASRVVWRRNTREWLRGQGPPVELPPKFNIVSGLPDVSEVRPRLSAAEYEEWCVEVIRAMIELLPADQVAIFYQTPGRYSGEGGSWLDKGYLCTRGAREAGAACVWQKVVLFQDSVGRERGGTRPGFVQMLCFSKRHRGEVTGGIDMHQATLQPSLLHSHHSVYCAEQCHGTTRL